MHLLETMKMSIVSRKLIKPSTPTPQNLKNYKISFLDQLIAPMNMAFLLFYPPKPQRDFDYLQESLAKILPQFYVLAGRYLKDEFLVDCSDQGAEWVRAEVDGVELTELVGKTETKLLYDLLGPQFIRTDEAATTPLLSIRTIELIKCGGVVMCITVSHRVMDASSAGAFIAAWSNATVPVLPADHVIPTWDLPLMFPLCVKDHRHPEPEVVSEKNIVIKSFLFNKEAIARLRSKLLNGKAVKVSMARLVSALITMALIRLDRAKYAKPRDCFIVQPVDMRGRITGTSTPSLQYRCGNLALATLTRCIAANETEEIGIQELVDVLGDAIRRSLVDYAGIVCPDKGCDIVVTALGEYMRELMNGEVNFITFSDLSKFEFYEADFGWGKPVWTTVGPLTRERVSMLMSNREGDGIEARVYLESHDMLRFEQDHDITSFATTY